MHFVRQIVRASIISLIAGLVWTGQAAAIDGNPAETAYLRIDDLKGTATASGFKDLYVVLSYTNAPGKTVVYVPYNPSVAPLMTGEANRTHFKQAELDVVAPIKGEDKVIKSVEMQDVTVTLAYVMNGSPNCGRTECIQATLTYSK
jgi:hypothetical protein